MGDTDVGYAEDEIDLVERFFFLWGKRTIIFSGTLIFILIATIVSFYLPKNYLVQMEIYLQTDHRPSFYMEELDNLTYQINTHMINGKLEERLSELGLKPIPENINCKVISSKSRKLFTVILSVPTPNIDFGNKILKGVYPIISQRLNGIIKQALNKDRNKIKSEQIQLEENISFKNSKLSILGRYNQRLSYIDAMVVDIESNSVELKNKQKKLIVLSEQENEINLLAALLYTNTIQQNLYMINSLMNERNWTIENRQTIKKELDFVNSKIEANNNMILNIEKTMKEDKGDISLPKYSNLLKKIYSKYTIIGSAGVAGFFLMVLIVLLIEKVTNYKERKKLR